MNTIRTKNGRFPTKPIDEALLRRLWIEGVPIVEIGRRLGCSKSLASKLAHRIGLQPRTKSTGMLPAAAIERAYVDHNMTAAEIARRIGSNPTSVYRVLKLRNVPTRPHGPRHPDLRAECVRLFRAGLRLQQVADRLGITRNQARHRVRSVLGPQYQGTPPSVPTERLVAWHREGQTATEIARRIGRARTTVEKRIKRALGARESA